MIANLLRTSLLAIGATVLTSHAGAADYRAEAAGIVEKITTIHPRGHQITDSSRFQSAKKALLEMAGDTDIPHYAVALGRLFAASEDGHTNVLGFYSDLPPFTRRYPVQIMRFDDGLYVVAAKDEAFPLQGRRIVSVNGVPVETVVARFAETMGADNPSWPANWAPQTLMRPAWLVGFDIADDDPTTPVEFVAVDEQGRESQAMLVARAGGDEGLTELAHAGRPLAPREGDGDNYVVSLEDREALVLVIGVMGDEEDQLFRDFTREAAMALAKSDAKRLIVDLRMNGGGDNMLVEPLRRLIVTSRFNRPGSIYVLTGPQTFSAAMNFATRLERETDALFVGEPAGGAPNHFGDPQFANGEVSGLPYIISTLLWQDSQPLDERRRILPDIPAAPTFADYVAGLDGALEAALSHVPDASTLEQWPQRAMQPWDRVSQKAGWRFFYESPR